MNSRQRATLQAIFETPTRADIRWTEIESLILALGGSVEQRRGSRVALCLKGRKAIVHRPHPRPETNRPTVRDVRELLKSVGIDEHFSR